jgi:peptide/nickel transport system substrate-binding protein
MLQGGGVALAPRPAAAQAQAPALRIAVEADNTSLDPLPQPGAQQGGLAHIFEALILQDAEQKLVPGLATSWRAVDERTWELHAAPGRHLA